MTYPDSGAPADPRDELAAIRRRLAETAPTARGNGLLVAGGLALAGAFVALIVALVVASTLGGGGQAAVLIAGLCVVAGFAVLGLSVLRRWQIRSGAVRRERLELLVRQDELAAALGDPGPPLAEPAPLASRADRVRVVAFAALGVLVLAAVVIAVIVRATS